MPLVPHIFRAYDIRGLIDTEIDVPFVHLLGRALAHSFMQSGHKRVLIGHDTRRNSKLYHDILAEEMTKKGLHIISIGMVPSPCLYFAVHELEIFAGIMVTASHNDAKYNGFKIWQNSGTLYGDAIQAIYRDMLNLYANEHADSHVLAHANEHADSHVLAHADTHADSHVLTHADTGTHTANSSSHTRGIASYFDIKPHYIKKLSLQAGRLPFKVVIDGSNASAGGLCCAVFEQLGAEVVPLYCEVTSDFPNHAPDPTIAENCCDLCQHVLNHNADCGIGLDGDGDRVVMVDRAGRILAADELLSLLAKDMILRKKGARILADVKCSSRLFGQVEELGGVALMGATGHSLMKKSMREQKAHLGGELSAHFFHAEDWFGTDDGILTAVRVLTILRDRKWDLTQFPDWEKVYATPEIRFDCPENKKHTLMHKVASYYFQRFQEYLPAQPGSQQVSQHVSQQTFQPIPENILPHTSRPTSPHILAQESETFPKPKQVKISLIDGIRVDIDEAWFLIRPSNTGAALTLRFEADNPKTCALLEEEVTKMLSVWLAELE